MFEHTSRYYDLEKVEYTGRDNRKIAYKRRRFLPHGREMLLLQELRTQEADRLDLITYSMLGDPLHFWQICDANDTMNPDDLTAETGNLIRVPTPRV